MKEFLSHISEFVEIMGVFTILIGITLSLAKYLFFLRKKETYNYKQLRKSIGRSIALGLEILIAADIMDTIITEPTFESVSILGLIIIIRIVLSLSLELEIDGKFPWQTKKEEK